MENTTTPPHAAQAGSGKLPSAFTLFGKSLQILGFNILPFLGTILIPMAVAIVVFILMIAITVGMSSYSEPSATSNAVLIIFVMLFVVAYIVGAIVINTALVIIFLKGARNEKITLQESIRLGLRFCWRMLVLGLTVGLLVIVGFMLLIVPGLFVIKRYLLSPFYLVDHNVGPLEAMRLSAEDSKRFGGGIWGLMGVTLLIGLASMIPFGGILQILYMAAPAARYEEICQAKGQRATAAPTTPTADLAPAPPPPAATPGPMFS